MAASGLHAQLQQLLSRTPAPVASREDLQVDADASVAASELHAALQQLLSAHGAAGSPSIADDGSVAIDLFGSSNRSSGSDQEGVQHVHQQKPARVTAKRARQTGGGSRTYSMRKEEKSSLQLEMQQLQAQVAYLKCENQFLTSHPHLRLFTRDPALLNTQAENENMLQSVHSQQLAFAGLQSACNQHVSTASPLPFRSRIRLGKDWHERDATLLAMKDWKLRSAQLYLAERTRFLDPCVPFGETSRFVTPEGALSSLRFDITVFEGESVSVKQVFDALLFYFYNMEISVSEMLGDITIREEDGIRQQGVSQSRLISNVREDVQVEINSVMFCKLYEASEAAPGGGFGVVVADSITDDALYPYSPATRLRNDITAAVTLSLQPRKRWNQATGVEDSEFVVVMKRTCMQSLHRTELPFSDKEMEEFRVRFDGWADTMIQSIRDTLYPNQRASTGLS